jgi:hypothetical protein
MALVHVDPVAVLHRSAHRVEVGEVDHRVDALGVQVQPQRHQVHVPGPLAVAEQAALHPLRARQHRQFRGRDAGAAIVVRVHREDHRVPPCQVSVHVLDLIGVDVRGGDLHRRGQVVDHRPGRVGVPQFGEAVAHLEDEVRLGQVEHLGRELEARARRGVAASGHVLRRVEDQPVQLISIASEHDRPPGRCGRRVHVQHHVRQPAHRFEGSLDQVGAGGGEDHNRDVVGYQSERREVADEIEVGLAGGRVADLDLLVAHGDQLLEEATLAGRVHRLGQRLVAVAQVDGHPQRRDGGPVRGPGALGQRHRHPVGVRPVAVRGHRGRGLGVPVHGGLLCGSRSIDRHGRTPRQGAGPVRPRRGVRGAVREWPRRLS